MSNIKSFESRIVNPLLTIFFLALFFMDLDSVSVHKHAKKERGHYPTQQVWSITFLRINMSLTNLVFKLIIKGILLSNEASEANLNA